MKAMPVIKRSDCKFYINEDKRTIVCVIPDTKYLLDEFIKANNEFMYDNYIAWETLEMPHSFSGKAVCSDEDEWDEELGKTIAYARARRKMYNSFFRRANTYVNMFDKQINDMISNLNALGEKVTEWQDNLQKEVEKKISGEA